MNPDQAEAQFWAAFLRNRNVDAGTADDGAISVAGGYAIYVKDTYHQLALGLGTTRPLREDDLAAVEAFFDSRGAPVRLELTDEVYQRDRAVLEAAGYAVSGPAFARYEATTLPEAPLAPGVTVRATTDRAAWVSLVTRAFAEGGTPDETSRRSAEITAAAAHGLFVADVDGVPAGAGAVAVYAGTAFLFSGAILPHYRRRGAHRALLHARTAFAATRDATLTTIKTLAASDAERSVISAGFDKATLIRRAAR